MDSRSLRRLALRSVDRHRFIDQFLHRLSESDELELVESGTRPPPIDPFAGLGHVQERLWSRGKILSFFMQFVFMIIHIFYVVVAWSICTSATQFAEDTQEIGPGGIKLCWRNAANATDVSSECIQADVHRWNQMQVLAWFEFLIVIPLSASVLINSVCFLAGCEHLPEKRPWFFFFGPNYVLGFSTLSFLQMAVPARFASLVCAAEYRFWSHIWFYSIWDPLPFQRDEIRTGNGLNSKKCRCAELAIFLIVAPFAIALSFQALLVKLIFVHFAAVQPAIHYSPEIPLPQSGWTFSQWLLFLGFLTQLSQVINVQKVELHRLFLFWFGGHGVRWKERIILDTMGFLRLLAERIVTGPSGKGSCSDRFCALTIMWAFDAADFQRLLMCPLREERLASMKALRLDYLKEICDQQYLERLTSAQDDQDHHQFQHALVLERNRFQVCLETLLQKAGFFTRDAIVEAERSGFAHSQISLIKSLDAGSGEPSSSCLVDSELIPGHRRNHYGLFHVAGEIENMMWDLEEMELNDCGSDSDESSTERSCREESSRDSGRPSRDNTRLTKSSRSSREWGKPRIFR